MVRRTGFVLLLFTALAAAASAQDVQTVSACSAGGARAWAPFASAKPFQVVLTCAVLETDRRHGLSWINRGSNRMSSSSRPFRGPRRHARRRFAHRPAALLPVRVTGSA